MVVDKAHFAESKDSRTGFHGLTVRDIIAYYERTFPPEPEDNRIVEDMLREVWDPGARITCQGLNCSIANSPKPLLNAQKLNTHKHTSSNS